MALQTKSMSTALFIRQRAHISSERAVVDKDMAASSHGLLFVETEKFGHYSSRSQLHQEDMIYSDAIEAVFKCEAALNFVCFDHGFEDIGDVKWSAIAILEVGNGQDLQK